ncbi:MAG: hypothetical protein OXC31_26115 [Spirochaetaceae bacterium]|nr:hypothetical protein [Spirochaetaceae bacterium]
MLKVVETSGEYYVTGERGELVAHAMRLPQSPVIYGVWVPGPGSRPIGDDPPVATICLRNSRWTVEGKGAVSMVHAPDDVLTHVHLRDAIVAGVRAVMKARPPVVGGGQEDPTVWTMQLAVGLAISALVIVAMIVDIIRLAI